MWSGDKVKMEGEQSERETEKQQRETGEETGDGAKRRQSLPAAALAPVRKALGCPVVFYCLFCLVFPCFACTSVYSLLACASAVAAANIHLPRGPPAAV